VTVGERSQQSGDNADHRAAVVQPLACLLQEEVCGFALMSNIESYSASVVSMMGLRSTLPTVLIAMSTPPKASTAVSNSGDISRFGQVALHLDGFDSRGLHGGHGLVGIGLASRAVVVHRDVDALFRQRRADQSAQVLGSGGHHRRFSGQVTHDGPFT
jgi:hypothetical protein